MGSSSSLIAPNRLSLPRRIRPAVQSRLLPWLDDARITHTRLNVRHFRESPSESSLYLPVKRFLEKLGFEVKGEVCGCDLVALREGEPPVVVIGELKLAFTLDLVLQAVDRSAACDEIWLAVRASRQGRGRERDPRVRKLCRLLGLGLLSVSASGKVEVLVEPVPWRPRRDARRRSRIVDEHRRRQGDPAVGGATLRGKPTSVPRLEVLSEVEIGRLATYEGPTWLDEAIIGNLQVQKELPGFPAELRQALADRGRWLAARGLADASGSNEVAPKHEMMRSLRQRETAHLAETLSRQLNALHVPHEPGSRSSGVYECAITTPTGKLAVIRSADTFTLAPWKPALEPLRGRAVLGLVGPSRVRRIRTSMR